VQISGDYF